MLATEYQPNPLTPHPLSRPILWFFRNTEHEVQAFEPAAIFVIFTAGTGADGQEFTLGGETFSTDSAEPYTAQTFYYDSTAEQAARNFAAMVRSAYRFFDWSVSVSDTGAGWLVSIVAPGDEPGNTDSDLSTLVPAVSATVNPGAEQVLQNARMWFQWWEAGQAVSERRAAAITEDGRVRVDAQGVARDLLDMIDPYLVWTAPALDELATRRVYLRYGLYELDENCNRGFSSAYESGEVTLINSVRQPDDLTDMRPFTPDYTLPVQWLDSRPLTRYLSRDTFEFSAVYANVSGLITDPNFRLLITYFNAAGTEIGMLQRGFRETGFYHIPVGPRNLVHNAAVIAGAASYTVAIQFFPEDGLGWLDYSETITVQITDDSCKAAEVYYQDFLGAWATMRLDRVERRELQMLGVAWQTPIETSRAGLSPSLIQVSHEGGRENRADNADEVFFLSTPPVAEIGREFVRQFLLSPRHFILTDTDLTTVATRRVLIDRTTYGLINRGQATRAVVGFRFNEPIRNR